jgi:hypothetical protein
VAGLYIAQTLDKCGLIPGSSQVLSWDKFRLSYGCEGDPEPPGRNLTNGHSVSAGRLK